MAGDRTRDSSAIWTYYSCNSSGSVDHFVFTKIRFVVEIRRIILENWERTTSRFQNVFIDNTKPRQ